MENDIDNSRKARLAAIEKEIEILGIQLKSIEAEEDQDFLNSCIGSYFKGSDLEEEERCSYFKVIGETGNPKNRVALSITSLETEYCFDSFCFLDARILRGLKKIPEKEFFDFLEEALDFIKEDYYSSHIEGDSNDKS